MEGVRTYDAIVVGLGGMGSAAFYHLAARGRRVLGIEQYGAAHTLGSSHGKTRMIRQAYYEDPAYVPLVLRAYELWESLAAETPEPIWAVCGGITVGASHEPIVSGTIRSAAAYGLKHEVLDIREARRRFPATRPRVGEVVIWEPTIGALFPEQCVTAHLDGGLRRSGEALFHTQVVAIEERAQGACVVVSDGRQFEAERVVVCAGPWIREVAGASLPVRIERNVQHWFAAAQPAGPPEFPIFMVARPGWKHHVYGFPDFGDGVKLAFHHSDVYAPSAAELDRTVQPAEVDAARAAFDAWAPEVAGAHLGSTACMYSMTPDEHFLIGTHTAPSVIIAGGFSGHGFKFCSVVGEVIAQIVIDGRSSHSLERFRLERFAAPLRP